MELTKKDRKHIEEETRKVALRIKTEATEYARLYELTYLECLKNEIDREIRIRKAIAESSIEISNK